MVAGFMYLMSSLFAQESVKQNEVGFNRLLKKGIESVAI